MASQGPLITATGADDATVGTLTWSNPTNVQANDTVYATATSTQLTQPIFISVKLVKGGTIQGNDNADSAATTSSDVFYLYGSATDLWGLTLADTDINASNFGCVFSLKWNTASPQTSHYIKGTNFSFSVPSGATINGITAELEVHNATCFIAGTKIQSTKGEISIEDLKINDQVLCFDEITGEIHISNVLAIKKSKSQKLHHIKTINHSVSCTPLHRFFCGKEFIQALDIRPGMFIQVISGGQLIEEEVISNGAEDKKAQVFNFEVEKYHTYFANRFAVHNIKVTNTASADTIRMTVYYTAAAASNPTVVTDTPATRHDGGFAISDEGSFSF